MAAGYFALISLSIILIKPAEAIIIKENIIFNVILLSLSIFFIFNICNKCFLGDNGIYFLSAIFGYNLINFSNQNIEHISPFYVVSLLWYPCFENLFSIIRRLYNKIKVSEPDNSHLHTLIYFKLSKKYKKEISNNLSSILILIAIIPGFVLSNFFIINHLY